MPIARQDRARSFVSRELGERGLAEGVDLSKEALFGRDQRRIADPRGENVGRR